MLEYAEPVTKLIDELKRLPSIGHKSAQRLAFHLMRTPEADVERLITAVREVKKRIILCSICNNLTEIDPCRFCASPSRDRSKVCITCFTEVFHRFVTWVRTNCIFQISCRG